MSFSLRELVKNDVEKIERDPGFWAYEVALLAITLIVAFFATLVTIVRCYLQRLEKLTDDGFERQEDIAWNLGVGLPGHYKRKVPPFRKIKMPTVKAKMPMINLNLSEDAQKAATLLGRVTSPEEAKDIANVAARVDRAILDTYHGSRKLGNDWV